MTKTEFVMQKLLGVENSYDIYVDEWADNKQSNFTFEGQTKISIQKMEGKKWEFRMNGLVDYDFPSSSLPQLYKEIKSKREDLLFIELQELYKQYGVEAE